MRVIDYYEKYRPKFFPESSGEVVGLDPKDDLLYAFAFETIDIMSAYTNPTKERITNIVIEQNDKWNALVRRFNDKKRENPLMPDEFVMFWVERMGVIGRLDMEPDDFPREV